ncbi:MFS transporter [Halanaeroarchaeum sulfurireducens]|uniref:Major facilitator superfamily protein n=1 Tax=Halanaeroarchaeum sulfurireducens TaxID=1604004 RepID=A0A0F7P7U5_9EURY|nr:MFS transporter [Halanaeroarchaeum sulfurireducens]AKH96782.1 major facilitator superfamily protein [Halanaeroarchaeum sulfurireducens]
MGDPGSVGESSDGGDRTPGHVIWVLLASSTLTVMAGAVLGPVVNDIQAGLGVTQSLAGLIITTHGLFIVLASPLAGSIVDRFGPRRPAIAGLLLYGFAGGAGLVVESFSVLLASRAVLGIGVAFVYTGITVLIYQLYVGDRKNRAMGLRASANSLGATVWPLVGGALGTLSWHAPFGVYLVAVPLGLATVAMVPEQTKPKPPGSDDGSAFRAVVATVSDRPVLALVYLLYFTANLLLYANVVYYPRLLAGFGVDSSFTISLYLSALGLAGGTSGVLYDRVKRRFSFSTIALVALAFWTVAFAVAGLAGTRWVAVLPVVLFGLGQGLAFPTVMLWVEELVPPERTGQFSSYIAMFGYIGQFLSPVAFGAVVAASTVPTAFLLTGGAVGAAFAGFVAVGRHR